MDEEPVGGRAGLAHVAHLGEHRAVDGRVEVGVGEDQERRVAAELHRDPEQLVGGLLDQLLPTGVEPVKVSLRSRGSPMSGSITSPVCEVEITLSTPGGTPTSSSRSARASMVSGVWLAGLTTIVQPAAIAGPILRVPIASGKFHGVIISVGPTGCFIVISRVVAVGRRGPAARDAHDLLGEPPEELGAVGHLALRLRRAACPSPGSSASRSSSARSVTSSKAERRISARSRGARAGPVGLRGHRGVQRGLAVRGVAEATAVSVFPVAGSSTSMVEPSAESRHSPPMNRPVGTFSRRLVLVHVSNLGCGVAECLRGSVRTRRRRRTSAC